MTELGELVGQLMQASEDPYPTYDRIREHSRVCWVPDLGRWLVTGHREVLAVLNHGRVSVDRRRYGTAPDDDNGGYRPGGLPFVDPPDHTRLRSLVQDSFSPKTVARLRPEVQRLTDELLTRAAERGEMDLIADFAGPLPAIVLAGLLGIPARDQAMFRSWAMTIIETIDPVSHRVVSEDGHQARTDLTAYLTEVVAARRRRPEDDLISRMVRAEESGQRLTAAELLEMCLLLAIVGLETTTNLIGNGMSALLAHPAQLRRLREDPALVRGAVEELLRYDAPVQLAGRVAAEDIELAGQALRQGQVIGLVLGAANRDPLAFPLPDRLDIARGPANHVGFGRGIHFCLGAATARLEGAVAITALVTRFPDLRQSGAVKRRQNVHVRGFESLPLALN
ncbi:cytochrome P450 [Solihabitans fulvus]|uniref:Cytochrome P450 n=1 Tax=Solihabitans fulvus TaxID=1892852 RepID=A0A5B2XS28_9PSEU|nr:cytochrome P450 [Solihabitans fulvus]KAA2265770.1 cytochrome P450 [Solihabitans fulvus]